LCCIVLYCIVLYCIVLYCIVLYCIVLYCIVLLDYIVLYYDMHNVACGIAFVACGMHCTAVCLVDAHGNSPRRSECE